MADTKQTIIVLVGSALLVLGLAAFFGGGMSDGPELLLTDESGTELTLDAPLVPEELGVTNVDITNNMNPTAVFTTNLGTIELELFEDVMPVTVGNFVTLAEEGFYNGTKFHRVINGFMIQGGDPNSKSADSGSYGTGGPGYTIQDEFVAGDLLTNTRGTIAMANTGQPNSGGSQWFINLVDNSNLDFDKQPLSSRHPVFGRVTAGLDVVDTIAQVETGHRDVPTTPVVIESIAIRR